MHALDGQLNSNFVFELSKAKFINKHPGQLTESFVNVKD